MGVSSRIRRLTPVLVIIALDEGYAGLLDRQTGWTRQAGLRDLVLLQDIKRLDPARPAGRLGRDWMLTYPMKNANRIEQQIKPLSAWLRSPRRGKP